MKIDRWYQPDCTIGRLSINNFQCFTLELPDLGNEQDISCIPDGRYEYYFRESPSNGNVLELRNVPDRSYIQIHAANHTRQLRGCIAVGDSVRFLDSDKIPDITNSKKTLSKLLEVAGPFGILHIR